MKTINVYEVKVSKNFLLSNLGDKKLEKAKRYIEKHRTIDRPIVLCDGVLMDGYSRFIAAYQLGLKEVPYIELEYIVGKFDNCSKTYIWKNNKGFEFSIGDKAIVKAKSNKDDKRDKRAIVTVVGVHKTSDCSWYEKHKPVVGKCLDF